MDILGGIANSALGPGFIELALGAMMATLVSAMFVARVSLRDQKRRAKQEKTARELRSRIVDRLSNSIEVTVKDFDRFRNALELPQNQAKRVVDNLYSEELSEDVTAEVIEKLGASLGELEDKQPYDNLPGEVRPSLIRIEKRLSASPDEEDKAVLVPVVHALNSYVQLVRQKGRLNMHRNVAYGIGAASLVVGLAALFLSPSPDDLARNVAAELAKSADRMENTSPLGG